MMTIHYLSRGTTDDQPDSGPRYTGRTPTPSEARNWATMAGATLRALVRIHLANEQIADALEGRQTTPDEMSSVAVQRIHIGEAMGEIVQLQAELDAYAAANCGGVVVLPAEE